jgi:hypothetical protein
LLKQKSVLPRVNSSSALRTLPSTAATLYGADGLMTPVTLRTVLMPSALRDAYCRGESVEKP